MRRNRAAILAVRRWLAPLTRRTVVAVLLVHAVLLSLLYVSLDSVVARLHSWIFETAAHAYAERVVDELESGSVALEDRALHEFLGRLRASGFVTFAEFDWHGRALREPAELRPDAPPIGTRDTFGSGDDRTYFVTGLWRSGSEYGVLRLGFDESSTHGRIRETRALNILIMGVYLALAAIASLALARAIVRPIDRVREAAARIAGGDVSTSLATGSSVLEIDELGRSLERMRAALATAAARLNQKHRLETIGTLAGGVAHEFNNVLVPIILFLESAESRLGAEHPARMAVGRALGAAERARDVVSKLLVFSGHGAGARLQPMRIAAAVEDGVRLFSSLRPSYIELESKIDAASDPVLADAGLVTQIVMNLCTNAYHAIPPSGGTITVTLANVVCDGQRRVELAVADTGVGMDVETRSRMFEPFFTTRPPGQGSGLGLAVVHGLVEDMGGTIEVESEPGAGTRVRLLVPPVGGEV